MRQGLLLPLLLFLSSCVAPADPTQAPTVASTPSLRPDLAAQWLGTPGQVKWPPAEGFAGPAILLILPPGTLVDRFGSEQGRFLSPKGAPYAARALPYVCPSLTYTVYRVRQPLPVWAGKAAPWFDEPGGATQFETDAPVATLRADRVIEKVMPDDPAGVRTEAPC